MSKVSIEVDDAAQAELDAERRRSHRAELVVRVDYSTIDELFSEFTRDINEGGLFIETEKPRPMGTEVAMCFNLPGSNEVVETQGRVVRISSGEGHVPPGMGIEFDELTPADRQRVNEIIRALRIGPPAE
ncbi:MAG: TIGR02266 family protein [Deltaproteobacteria bacterium]|nr:TIGR02266 family protein [Deltaproteobacteria bacterium]MBW2420669.1 TIGR02266 family protein [Deltaproteobacteria bacterium]